jgi:hypothetical protein
VIFSTKYDYWLISLTIFFVALISEAYENLSLFFDFKLVRYPLFFMLLVTAVLILSKTKKVSVLKLNYFEVVAYFFVFICLSLMIINKAFTWAYYIIFIPVLVYYATIRIQDPLIKTQIKKTLIFISILVILELTIKWSLGIYDNNLLLKRIESNLLGRPITVGYILIISLILSHSLLTNTKFLMYTVMTGMGVVFLNSRSITVAYIITVAWFYFSNFRLNGKLKLHQIYMIFAAIVLGLTVYQIGYYSAITDRFSKKNDPSTLVRVYALETLFDSFSESSETQDLLFGHGFKYSDHVSKRLTKDLFPSTNGVSFEVPLVIFILDFGLIFALCFLAYHAIIFFQVKFIYMIPLLSIISLTSLSSAYSHNLSYGTFLMLTLGLLNEKK